MGSVPNCRKEIANRYPIRWFKCKLKPPKNRIGIPFSELPDHLKIHGHKIEWEPKDGHCLLHSLSDSVWNEFHEFYDVELLKTLMISEIEDNNDRYRRHYNGTLFELLKGVYDYVKDGKYSQDCVDLCRCSLPYSKHKHWNISKCGGASTMY